MFERPRWLKAAPNSPWAFLEVNVWTLKKTVDDFVGSLTINIRKVQYSVFLWLKIVYPKKHHQNRSSKFEIRKISWNLVTINFSRGTYPLGNQHIPVIHTKTSSFQPPGCFHFTDVWNPDASNAFKYLYFSLHFLWNTSTQNKTNKNWQN